ncbi:FecCD family ABC transporter permease [Segeticoccus rhizosphaerae]|uniref:FecCD family ABC transporter permease n=1 Tax=Segeticoccus rhizosphaerae TaxID=1104777 RepID=UPI001EEF8F2D|nr:iron ABC transporter permease [Segeticoccus rhizosphaerae]
MSGDLLLRARTGSAGRQTRQRSPSRRALPLAACLGLLGLAVLASLALGSKAVSLPDVLAALRGQDDPYLRSVVDSRVPRTAIGILAGACLAVSGVIMQGITRNPLGDPGLLGVNIGAAASVVTATAFLGVGGGASTVWVALPGAFLAMLLVHVVGSGRHGATPVRLVLAGAVLTAVLSAYVQAVTLSLPAVFDSYRFWVVGSLAGANAETSLQVLPFVVAGLVVAAMLAGPLNVLALGDATATALGAHPSRTRLAGVVAATLLCAASTAAVGPIAFVGLAVPHIVRSVVGSDHRWQLPLSLLLGPALLLAADVVGRVVLRPQELMVGVVTAFIGAPVLLVVVRRMRMAT